MIIKKQNIKKDNIKQDDTITESLNLPEEADSNEVSPENKELSEEDVIESFDDIDISNIDFQERVERRRGDRRRGYRRIDERSLVSRAQEEASNIKNAAKEEGYSIGLSEAQEEIQQIQVGLREFFSGKKEVYNELSNDILEIALEVARKIIKKEVELSNDVLKNILEEVLSRISVDEQKLVFKVSEDDYESALGIIPEMLKESKIDAKLTILPSEDIEKGSCILTANNGVIDANFKTQLQIIQNAFGIYKGKDDNA